jgi:hypothetical protein
MVDSQKRIAGAFLVGAILVSMAFVIRGNNASRALVQEGTVSIAPRTYIPIQDDNNDGIPNWQDELTGPEFIEIPTASSTYVEPTTVTGKFAVSFFEKFLRTKVYGVFGGTKEELVANASQELAEKSKDILFTSDDLTVFSSNNTQALLTYSNHVANIILAHPTKSESEALILQDALKYDKPEKLEELKPIAQAYTDMVKAMLETPVPSSYVDEHLNLTNAMNAVREDIIGMQKVNEDALYTLVRMKRYEDDVLGLSNTLTTLFDTLYLTDGVRWNEGDKVLLLMTFPE